MSARKLLACWTPLVLAFLCLGVGESFAQSDASRAHTLVASGSARLVATDGGNAPDVRGGATPIGSAVPVTNARMTRFDPTRNGFRFENTFKNDLGAGARSDGLCGGMMYAAMDYWLSSLPIPTIDYRPAIGTPLQTYLYDRQMTQIASNLDRFADMIAGIGPYADKRGYFERGINNATLTAIRDRIDAGIPVVLALQAMETPLGHSVLVIGYDMGRYLGDPAAFRTDVKLFVYDPNHKSVIKTLSPDPSGSYRYVYVDTLTGSDPHERWLTYFADTRYNTTPPPRIATPNLGGMDGKLRELRVTITTGDDELVGGNDDIDLIVTIDGRAPQIVHGLNNHKRWIANYAQTVSVKLDAPAAPTSIRSFKITKTAKRSLLGVDAWDIDGLVVYGYGGGFPPVRLFQEAGHRMGRLDATNQSFLRDARMH
jgi:hypothetical protein